MVRKRDINDDALFELADAGEGTPAEFAESLQGAAMLLRDADTNYDEVVRRYVYNNELTAPVHRSQATYSRTDAVLRILEEGNYTAGELLAELKEGNEVSATFRDMQSGKELVKWIHDTGSDSRMMEANAILSTLVIYASEANAHRNEEDISDLVRKAGRRLNELDEFQGMTATQARDALTDLSAIVNQQEPGSHVDISELTLARLNDLRRST
jgi:hypothetical protein